MNDIPALIPAEVASKFTYCPRLFHIEWVQSRFEHNPDTTEGRWRHRAVDQPAGRVPLPDGGQVAKATSVSVSSERIGVVAVIDALEPDGDGVKPVDTKKGHPPPHGSAWESELVQVCLQGLLLRENGYQCRRGEIYYAETNERRTIEFDDDLVRRTLGYIDALREVAAHEEAPPPLVDSPKCPRCSLVGLCLPDEVNTINVRSERPPRRLTPRDSAARPVYVTEQGAYAGLRSGRLEITKNREPLVSTRMIDVSQINLYGNTQISSQLIRECFNHEIPVCWFSWGGWFQGIAEGLPAKNIDLRRRQFGIALQAGLPVARRMVEGKIRNCRTLLRRNERNPNNDAFAQLKGLAERALTTDSLESLLGVEGTAARIYFSRLSTMFRTDIDFDFTARNRRPPRDPVNCLLSYLYALLTKDLTAVAVGVGFDPYLGVFHKPRFGRPALALDLAEEFRPLVADSVVVNVINNGEVRPSHFETRGGAVSLTSQGRKAVTKAYERRLDQEVTHPVFRYRITYRRVLEVQARLLAAYLMHEIPEYAPMVTR